MRPRYLSIVDANLEPVKVSVRVGQAVETVGQAGRPKTITGFQVRCCTSKVLYINVHVLYNVYLSIDAHFPGAVGIQGPRGARGSRLPGADERDGRRRHRAGCARGDLHCNQRLQRQHCDERSLDVIVT
jgi:hypothetical protein